MSAMAASSQARASRSCTAGLLVTGVMSIASDDPTAEEVTGQVQLDSYADTGAVVAVELVNALTVDHASERLAAILAVDPPSRARLRARDAAGFVSLAHRLREVFDDLRAGDVDAAADRLSALLAAHPAAPHLAKEDGRWRLHHHPVNLALVPMWTSICAEAIARLIGA